MRSYLNSAVSARNAPMTTPKRRSPLPASSTMIVTDQLRLSASIRCSGVYKNSPHTAIESESGSLVSKAFSATSVILYIQGAVLRVKTQNSRRNRVFVVLLMPAVIFLWVVGWSLYWIGHQRDDKRAPISKPSGNNVHLKIISFEEKPEITA
jgi:hypothetical protein